MYSVPQNGMGALASRNTPVLRIVENILSQICEEHLAVTWGGSPKRRGPGGDGHLPSTVLT